ncbi:hypothetical protein R1sor_003309 [Riccia sorocarpa]|uniref:Uncharacterized protein n=1 Tax=Riccia sorocarpa TaxID=122646 RepID=A0ABD3H3Y4_9MARC
MVGGQAMDCDGDMYVGGSGPGILQYSCSPASSSSSSNNEMKPRDMARTVNAQRATARHRMSRQDYELIVLYLEVLENFVAITGGGRKMKIGGKNWTKVATCGHMAVSLCAQGFHLCNGAFMGKKYNRYVETYKKARIFYKSTGVGLTDEEIAAGLFFEQKMEQKCIFFSNACSIWCPRQHRTACSWRFKTAYEEEVDVVDYQTGPDGGGHCFVPTARYDADGGPYIANQTARSALDVEDSQPDIEVSNVPKAPSRGGVSQHLGEDLRSSGRDRPSRPGRDRPVAHKRTKKFVDIRLQRSSQREVGSAKSSSGTKSYIQGRDLG